MVKKSKKAKSDIQVKFKEFQEAFVNKLVFLTDKYGADWPQEWFDYELALDEENWEIIVNFSINPPDDLPLGGDTFGCVYLVKTGDVIEDAIFIAEQLSWRMMSAYYIDMDRFIDEGWL